MVNESELLTYCEAGYLTLEKRKELLYKLGLIGDSKTEIAVREGKFQDYLQANTEIDILLRHKKASRTVVESPTVNGSNVNDITADEVNF